MIDIEAALAEAEKAADRAQLIARDLGAKADLAQHEYCEASLRVMRLRDLQKAMASATLHGDL